MGKLSRTKGANWEREVARMFREVMPGAECVRRGGQQARDAHDAPDVDVAGWLAVEAKHGRQVQLRAALSQALEHRKPSVVPVAICRDHGSSAESAMVLIELQDVLGLVAALWDTGSPKCANCQGCAEDYYGKDQCPE